MLDLSPYSIVAPKPPRLFDHFPTAHRSLDEKAGKQTDVRSFAPAPVVTIAL
ncbi:MAG: hypothetical protein ACR2NN_27850 [Bryobacteraceae bacterium]